MSNQFNDDCSFNEECYESAEERTSADNLEDYPQLDYLEEDDGTWGDDQRENELDSLPTLELPGMDALKSRTVKVLSNYDILTSDDDEVMIAVPHLEAPGESRFYYDGGQHAILLKNDDCVVVCKHVNLRVRGHLVNAGHVLIVEVSSQGKADILEQYDVRVQVQPLPDMELMAEELMRLKGAQLIALRKLPKDWLRQVN